jgi:hypothetical protein
VDAIMFGLQGDVEKASSVGFGALSVRVAVVRAPLLDFRIVGQRFEHVFC